MVSKYKIAKYLRLSSDDGNEGESNSISNQRDLLDDYIGRHFESDEITVVEFIDDGHSGTNFNRPGVKKLLKNAESKKFDCIIVKDFSRFGREHAEAGEYLEEKFPEWQIRFISVNDCYDSNDYCGITSGIDIAIKNMVYELYSRDLSVKVKSAKKVKMKRGKFISPYAFYGYIKDPDDKNKLLVDSEAADVVRRLFQMRADGMSSTKIAITFNNEGILTPSMYKDKNNCKRKWTSAREYVYWSDGIVDNLLNDERYTGKMISGKMKRDVIGSPKVTSVEKENWVVVPNTHEAIVSQELFDHIKKQRSLFRTKREKSEISMLGLLRCGCCHHRLSRYGKDAYNVRYYCEYRKYTAENDCVTQVIEEIDIVSVLKKAIKLQIERAVDLEKTLNEKRNNQSLQIKNQLKNLHNRLGMYKKERFEMYKLFQCGHISGSKMNRDKQVINKNIAALENEISALEATNIEKSSEEFIKHFKEYQGFTALQDEIVKNLVDAIYIYNDNKIEIVWKHADDFIKENSQFDYAEIK